MPSIVLSWRT